MATAQLLALKLRETLSDNFIDDKGTTIEYTQLQLEKLDSDSNRIEIIRVSVRREHSTAILSTLKPLYGKNVNVPVDITANNNRTRYQLAGEVVAA